MPTPENSFKYRWIILGVCWMAYIVAYVQRLSIGPLAPFLKTDLSLTAEQIGTLMSASALGYTITLIPAGWLVDRIGARWILLVGEVIGGIFIAAMFFATSYTTGLIFMGLAGLGLGFIMPTTTKAVVIWFPSRERATAMGLKQTGLNVGGIVAAATLPAVAIALTWHYGFLATGTVSVLIGILSFVLYKEPPAKVVLPILKTTELEKVKPSLKEILKHRDIWLVSCTGFCLNAVEFSVMAYFVLYLQSVLAFAVVAAGMFLAILQAGGAAGKPLAGFISDRAFGGKRKRAYLIVIGTGVVLCAIWSLIPSGFSLWMIGLLAVILGLSSFSWGGLHLTLVSEIAGKELTGAAIGVSTVVQMIGNILGPPVFGYIIDSTGSYRMAWQFLAVLGIIGVILLLFVREDRRRI
jgi:MFS transporter, ACS family, hexuronate transporter